MVIGQNHRHSDRILPSLSCESACASECTLACMHQALCHHTVYQIGAHADQYHRCSQARRKWLQLPRILAMCRASYRSSDFFGYRESSGLSPCVTHVRDLGFVANSHCMCMLSSRRAAALTRASSNFQETCLYNQGGGGGEPHCLMSGTPEVKSP